MTPRAKKLLLDAMLAAILIAAVAVRQGAYTRTANDAPAVSTAPGEALNE